MKRTALRRGKGFKSQGTGLPRRTRLAPVNRARKGHRFPKRRDAKYCAWIRTLPCLVWSWGPGWIDGAQPPCAGRVECAHVRSRGAGGDDRGNTVPLCTRHHREQHALGIRSFGARYELDLTNHALVIEVLYPASPGSLQGATE